MPTRSSTNQRTKRTDVPPSSGRAFKRKKKDSTTSSSGGELELWEDNPDYESAEAAFLEALSTFDDSLGLAEAGLDSSKATRYRTLSKIARNMTGLLQFAEYLEKPIPPHRESLAKLSQGCRKRSCIVV